MTILNTSRPANGDYYVPADHLRSCFGALLKDYSEQGFGKEDLEKVRAEILSAEVFINQFSEPTQREILPQDPLRRSPR